MPRPHSTFVVECQTLVGLAPVLEAEIRRRVSNAKITERTSASVTLTFTGRLPDLLGLRTATAVHLVVSASGQRPSALLGGTGLDRALTTAMATGRFSGFHLSMAGRTTRLADRLRERIALATGLPQVHEGPTLLVRVRRSGTDWQALVRVTPAPLSSRGWRVREVPGALNACLAAAMVELTSPEPTDRFLDPMCGSATIAIERSYCGPCRMVLASDVSERALASASVNVQAAGRHISLLAADAGSLPLGDRSFDAICVNLPFGHRVGSHRENRTLYPAAVAETARVAGPGARMVVLTHEIRLFEATVREAPGWRVMDRMRVEQGGQYPGLFVLRRRGRSPG